MYVLNKLPQKTVEKIWYYWHSGHRGHRWKDFKGYLKMALNMLYEKNFEYGGHTIKSEDDIFGDEDRPKCFYQFPYSTTKNFYRCTFKEHWRPLWLFFTNKHHRKVTRSAYILVIRQAPKAFLDLIRYYLPWRCHGDSRPKIFRWDYTKWTVNICDWLEHNWRSRTSN